MTRRSEANYQSIPRILENVYTAIRGGGVIVLMQDSAAAPLCSNDIPRFDDAPRARFRDYWSTFLLLLRPTKVRQALDADATVPASRFVLFVLLPSLSIHLLCVTRAVLRSASHLANARLFPPTDHHVSWLDLVIAAAWPYASLGRSQGSYWARFYFSTPALLCILVLSVAMIFLLSLGAKRSELSWPHLIHAVSRGAGILLGYVCIESALLAYVAVCGFAEPLVLYRSSLAYAEWETIKAVLIVPALLAVILIRAIAWTWVPVYCWAVVCSYCSLRHTILIAGSCCMFSGAITVLIMLSAFGLLFH